MSHSLSKSTRFSLSFYKGNKNNMKAKNIPNLKQNKNIKKILKKIYIILE